MLPTFTAVAVVDVLQITNASLYALHNTFTMEGRCGNMKNLV
jgi:hypothetical protein